MAGSDSRRGEADTDVRLDALVEWTGQAGPDDVSGTGGLDLARSVDVFRRFADSKEIPRP